MSKTSPDTHPEADFFRHLTEGRFLLQRSRQSGRFFFHPRVAEPGTGALDLEWVEASGLGRVYSTSVMRERVADDSYNLALIDLDEGPRMMARVEGVKPDQVRIGQRVQAQIASVDGVTLVLFHPTD